jgi:hypothetical protein
MLGTACQVVPIFVLLLKMSVEVTKIPNLPKNPKAKISKKAKKAKKTNFAKKS